MREGVRESSEQALPLSWEVASLADLVIDPKSDIVDGPFGSNLKASEYVDEGVPIIRLQNVKANEFITKNIRFISHDKAQTLSRHSFKRGDIVISKLGDPLGEACVVPDPLEAGIIVADVVRVRLPEELLDKLAVVLALNSASVQQQFKGTTKGTTRPRVNLNHVRAVKVPVPPLGEQRRIVAEIEKQFTRLDSAVAALKRVQANLKRYRASVLKAACEGRLVPTEAELARKEGRSYESGEQLLARILRERRAKWEADQLAKMLAASKPPKNVEWKLKYQVPNEPEAHGQPDLPEGWIWCSIGKIFEVRVGATPSRARPEYWNGNIPWVSSGEVAFCHVRSTRERITELGLRNSSTEISPPGTVLLGMIGEGRTRGQAAILDIAACNNQNSAAIRVPDAGLPPDYVFRYLEGQYECIRTLGSGNNQPALNKKRVQQMWIPLPPLAEQLRIAVEVERWLSALDRLSTEAEKAVSRVERLRQSILKRAFEGKLVPQDPNDEPASVLIERIRAERAALAEKARPSDGRKSRRTAMVHNKAKAESKGR